MKPTLRKVYPAAYVNAVDRILALPEGPKRWRASAALWLQINPKTRLENGEIMTARQMAAAIIEENKETRLAQANRFASGTDKNSALRYGLNFPPGMLEVIELFDDRIFAPDDAKRNFRRLMETFPEWRIPGAI